MCLLSFYQVSEITIRTVSEHPCSDHGKRPFRVMGIYFNPDLSMWYSAVDVGGLRHVYFEIRDRRLEPGEKCLARKADFLLPDPDAHYTTWINPDYKKLNKPAPGLESTAYESQPENDRFRGQEVLTLPYGFPSRIPLQD